MTKIDTQKHARVFFALWPDAAERAALAAWQVPLQQLCGGRTMLVQNLHNTLLFLGEVQVDRLEALQLAAQEVNSPAFQLVFDMARYWGHNHIVYAAPGNMPSNLTVLVGKLEQAMLRHRFKFDERVYKPHVTLLRHAHWTDKPLPLMTSVVWNVRDFVLVQSRGEDQAMHYELLAHFPLA